VIHIISQRLGEGFGSIGFKVRLNKIKGTKDQDKENEQHSQFETVQNMEGVYHEDECTQYKKEEQTY
jgi:hypothetical protein